jgi:hypothetical protein
MASSGVTSPVFRDSVDRECHVRYAMCLNIDNSQRDETFNPFFKRMPAIVEQINNSPKKIDVLIILQAGKTSCGHTWEYMAEFMASKTGLKYIGCQYKERGFLGKAVFIREETTAIFDLRRKEIQTVIKHPNGNTSTLFYVSKDDHPGFTNDFIEFNVHPVVHELTVDRTKTWACTIRDMKVRIAACEYPRLISNREKTNDCMVSQTECQILMGDFKSFKHLGGHEAVQLGLSSKFTIKHTNSKYTYQAYEYNPIQLSSEHHIGEDDQVMKLEGGLLQVRVSALTDLMFYDNTSTCLGENCFVVPMKGATEHDAIVAELVFTHS